MADTKSRAARAQARAPRAEDREEAKPPRRRRVPLGAPNFKLSAPPREGYHRHWINDSGSRLAQAEAGGYTFVEDADDALGKSDPGTKTSVIAGTLPDGSPMRTYLMEIPLEYYEEDQKAEQAQIDQFDQELRRGVVRGAKAQDDGAYYLPEKPVVETGSNPLIRRD
jgi:hypothetical protein